MNGREQALENAAAGGFDLCVIGGGATGAGCALDAQLRGNATVLVEAGDFAGGASSASTKMAHGGVRYLQEAASQLDIHQYRLVKHALRERAVMLRNAPHLSRTVEFLVPCRGLLEKFYYGVGLKLYQWISGKSSLLPSRFLTRGEVLRRMPALNPDVLTGGVVYADGQFDDARYAMALVETFVRAGGTALNYARVNGFSKAISGRIASAEIAAAGVRDPLEIRARAFVNATGPFSDAVRRLASTNAVPRMRPSKGSHLVFPLDGFSATDALMIPKTQDGRVVFAIPWNGRLVVGTTDTGYTPGEEMAVTKDETEYLLRQINPYLQPRLQASQVVSGFAGVRPLVAERGVGETKKLIRDDEVEYDASSGLISIMGGKWTTYRLMAEQTIDHVQKLLERSGAARTADYPLAGASGYHEDYWKTLSGEFGIPDETARHLAHKYGTLAPDVLRSGCLEQVVAGHPAIGAQVIYGARREMARTVEDILARRIGLELYSWRLAREAAGRVARLLGQELGWSAEEETAALVEYSGRLDRLCSLENI